MPRVVPHGLDGCLQRVLSQRSDRGLLRRLRGSLGVDFSSNDYLGFARDETLRKRCLDLIQEHLPPGTPLTGSTGSRLLSGDYPLLKTLETTVKQFHESPDALIFNSGSDGNVSFISTVPQPNDIVLYDSLIHNSVHAGMHRTRAKCFPFRHNDLQDLRMVLNQFDDDKNKNKNKNIFIVVESLYSMDGDFTPLEELVSICESRDNTFLYVDEAHASGVYGISGQGLVHSLNLQNRSVIVGRLHTFGKALGCSGAALLCSDIVRSYLINYASPVIYTTAPSPLSMVAVLAAYQHLKTQAQTSAKSQLDHHINTFTDALNSSLPPGALLPSKSPIQGIVVPGNEPVAEFQRVLNEAGFDVRAIRSPTVPAGTERLRVCIHAHNTVEELEGLLENVITLYPK